MRGWVKYGSLTLFALASVVLSFVIVHDQELRAETPFGASWMAYDPKAAVDALQQARDFPRSMDFVLIPGVVSAGEKSHSGPYGVMSHGHGYNQPLMLGEQGHRGKPRDFMLSVPVDALKAPTFATDTNPQGKFVYDSASPTLQITGAPDTRRAAGGVLYRPGGNATIDPSPENDPLQGRWKLTPDPLGVKKPGPMAYFSQVFGDPTSASPDITLVKNGADFRKFLKKIQDRKDGQATGLLTKDLRGAINNETPANFKLRVDFERGQPISFAIRQVIE